MIKCPGMAERFPNETAQQRTYRAFETLVAGNDASIDLVQAALLIASIEYPELDTAHYINQLDSLARRVRALLELPEQEISETLDPLTTLHAINQVLFTEEHFHGNQTDYMDPENSFFNRVLEEHTGIPITLSLLYIEVARRVDLRIDGIGLPYHFMVRCSLPDRLIYIDPFEGGIFLNEQECRERIRSMTGHSMEGKSKLHAQWFAPISARQFLYRMLNNLKQIYLHNDDYMRGLTISNLMVILMPHVATERRDRGLIHLQLKHYARALHDLMAYLELAPKAKDRYEILNQVKSIRQIMSMLN
ncbi:MAG: tetratricopeptide repeat protein [Ktedonobacteraceae bacterium]|nr:tetratricopeptide repeat protein [Ktedonobacteraceae bacterium]